jgi:hypothetical protein
MATASAKRPSKSDFVRQILKKDPRANRKAVEEAWIAAGHEGPISSALVSTLRSKLGLIGNARVSKSRRGASKRNGKATTQESGTPTGTSRAPRSGAQQRAIAEIEGDIDRLIFKMMVVGGLERIEDELRKVRRLLYRSLL